MNRWVKAGLKLALLTGAVAGAGVGFASLEVEFQRHARVQVLPEAIEIPRDEASLEEGRRLVQVKACADCHGADLGGKTFVNEAPVGVFTGPNLTPGKGSRVGLYRDTDWIRAIRYALDPAGRPLIMMPSGDFHDMSNQDLGRVIAYLKSLAPVDRENPPQKIGPVARVLYALHRMPLLFSFESLDLHARPPQEVPPEPTVQYGKYVVMNCTGCHGPGLSGGHIPGTPPNWPDAKNLTPSGRFVNWNFADFKKVLSEGLTPDGHQINPQFMPWKSTRAMTPVEMEALYKFIKQIPARPAGTR